jgi:IRSp53/MIM homology domain
MMKVQADTTCLRVFPFTGKPEVMRQLEISIADYNTKYANLELLERSAVKTALLEERSHFCFLIRCLKPVMVSVHLAVYLTIFGRTIALPRQVETDTMFSFFFVFHCKNTKIVTTSPLSAFDWPVQNF